MPVSAPDDLHTLAVFCPAVAMQTAPRVEELKACAFLQVGRASSARDAARQFDALNARVSDRLSPPRETSRGHATWDARGEHAELDIGRDESGPNVVLYRVDSAKRASIGQMPPPKFPDRVAGLSFGQTEGEARARCESASGVFLASTEFNEGTIAPTFACHEPHVDLPLSIETVIGLLCDGRVCEVSLGLRGALERSLQLLREKYGPPNHSTEAEGQCKKPAHRYSWLWGIDGDYGGMLRLVDDCGLNLFYDDASGMALRWRQAKERSGNY